MIKDSGERREFGTGAVRDMAEGKGDMFSLPPAAIIRVSKHYEQGAKKYGRNNYQKGIPISAFMDSALRHIFKYLDGQDDEDHLSAAAFNILGAIQMEERNQDMQDIETRNGQCGFEYKEPTTWEDDPKKFWTDGCKDGVCTIDKFIEGFDA